MSSNWKQQDITYSSNIARLYNKEVLGHLAPENVCNRKLATATNYDLILQVCNCQLKYTSS